MMAVAGIICEYNPFHMGHARHIEKTRSAMGNDCAIVCVMSGNFVQRGDFAVFNKHARARMAVMCGADLVLELPTPYVLLSAERFALAGVHMLDSLGVCDFISFGSESGDIDALQEAAEACDSQEAVFYCKEELGKGLSYASARQRAADAVLGERSDILKMPNNLLGIKYIRAVTAIGSRMRPMTVQRTGSAHNSDTGSSAGALRSILLRNESPWAHMPEAAAEVGIEEIAAGLGPVSMEACELAVLSRLRTFRDAGNLPGATEGLGNRFMRYAASEPTISAIFNKVRTKRYAMSRLRRMAICACLGITVEYTREPPPYIRVLAMNEKGIGLLHAARKKSRLPIITKPVSVRRLPDGAIGLFSKESEATDFYVLGYPDERCRSGGQEWRKTPVIVP